MVLFINACVRPESRTLRMAKALLEQLKKETVQVDLATASLPTLTADMLEKRTAACGAGDYSMPYFDMAKQFAAADVIVIAAPYYDLSFPALLKQYLETVCITGLTFRYSPEGVPIGLCKAKKLYYVTTAGGPIFEPAFGFGYVKALATGMFGIPECACFSAENLDIWGNDPEVILADSTRKMLEALA